MFAAAFLDAMILRLASLFLAGVANDEHAARQAARSALLAYDPRSETELMLVAEIISFSLHALDALSRSMAADLSISQLCRLRSNAVSLSREAHKAQRKLDQLRKAAALEQRDTAVAPDAVPVDTAVMPGRPPNQTWTQAYHQRQRDKRLAERAGKNLQHDRVPAPAVAQPIIGAPLSHADAARGSGTL